MDERRVRGLRAEARKCDMTLRPTAGRPPSVTAVDPNAHPTEHDRARAECNAVERIADGDPGWIAAQVGGKGQRDSEGQKHTGQPQELQQTDELTGMTSRLDQIQWSRCRGELGGLSGRFLDRVERTAALDAFVRQIDRRPAAVLVARVVTDRTELCANFAPNPFVAVNAPRSDELSHGRLAFCSW